MGKEVWKDKRKNYILQHSHVLITQGNTALSIFFMAKNSLVPATLFLFTVQVLGLRREAVVNMV